jgi:hypothetical protein
MKLLTEYLEHALTFERMASDEENTELRFASKSRQLRIASSWPNGQPDTGCHLQAHQAASS